MTTSIYDDPPLLTKPTSDELRIAELQTIVAGESDIRSVATLVQESLTQAETALRDKRVVLNRSVERELAPLIATVNRLHREAAPLREQLAQIGLAKSELLSLSPLAKQLEDLQFKLRQAELHEKGYRIRPVILQQIELFDCGSALHAPNPAQASAERRKLKRHDDVLNEIRAEIAAVARQIGIAS